MLQYVAKLQARLLYNYIQKLSWNDCPQCQLDLQAGRSLKTGISSRKRAHSCLKTNLWVEHSEKYYDQAVANFGTVTDWHTWILCYEKVKCNCRKKILRHM